MSSNHYIKSPLRFPGGKSRALEQIVPLIPPFREFREPMVGGGSVFLRVKQMYPHSDYWINDINYELYCFWITARDNISIASRYQKQLALLLEQRARYRADEDE